MDQTAATYKNSDHLVDLSTEPLAHATVVVVILALLGVILRAWAQWGTQRAWSSVLIIAMVRNPVKHSSYTTDKSRSLSLPELD